jgi:hypothetical protein
MPRFNMIRKLLLSFLFFLLSFFTFGKNTSALNITTIRDNYFSDKISIVASPITTTSTGGNWNNASSWVGGVVPTATDDVVIASGATITSTGTINAKTLTINGTLIVSGTVTLNSITQLTINGFLTFADNTSNIHLPSGTAVKVNSPGKVDDSGGCSNNVAIYIGSTKIAACKGNGGGAVYDFTQFNNNGGTINAIANSNSPVCQNGTINLIGSFSGSAGTTTSGGSTTGVNYSWSMKAPDGTTTTSNAQNYNLTASQTGSYTAILTCKTYYGTDLSTSTSTITVVVNQAFSINSVTVPTAQCLSSATVTIQATPAALPIGNYTVTYNRNDPWAINLSASMTVTTAGTGTFTATGLTNAGNTGTTITVTNLASGSCSNAITTNNVSNNFVMRAALSPPTLDGGGFASCSNYVVQILNQSPNATNYYLDVSTSNVFSTYLAGYQNKDLGTTFQHTIIGLTPGTKYYYRFRSANVCGTTANSAVGSFTAPAATGGPTPTFTTSPSGNVCANTSVTYTTESGKSNYQWTVPGNAGNDYTISGGGIGTSNNSVTLTWLTNGSKTVTVNYSSSGCLGSTQATNTVTVNPVLTASVTISHDQSSLTICQGTHVRFTATPTNGGTTPIYKWYNGSTLLTETSNSYLAYNVTSTDAIRVVMTSTATGCIAGSPATSNTISFTVITTDRGRTQGGGDICKGSPTPLLKLVNFDNPGQDLPYSYSSKVVRWEYSTDGNNTWTPIAGTQNLIQYQPAPADPLYILTVNTSFRAVTKTTVCTTEYYAIETGVQLKPVPTVTFTAQAGTDSCIGTDIVYATQPNQTNYVWTISGTLNTDYKVTGNLLSNTITVKWLTKGSKTVTVNYSNGNPNNCSAITPTASTTTVYPVPTVPTLGTIVLPTCTVPTGSITLNGLPGTGTLRYLAGNATTATYTINGTTMTISGLSPGKYKFAIDNPCGTSVYSAEANLSGNTWDGTAWSGGNAGPASNDVLVFAADYTATNDISGCSCTVTNNSKVTIKTGKTMTITNFVTIDPGSSLIFEDSSSLMQTNTDPNVNSGDIEYVRTTLPIRQADYVYWSTPVKNQTLAAVSPLTESDKYFRFDGTGWVATPKTNVMIAGKGYIIRGPEGTSNTVRVPYTATFKGTPNNGTITSESYNSGKYYLIGNPYPSAIDADKFLSDLNNKGLLQGTLYFWTHNTPVTLGGYYRYNADDYASYNLSGGTKTMTAAKTGNNAPGNIDTPPQGYIAAGQSFMAGFSLPGQIQFTNSMRIGGDKNGQFFKPGKTSKTTAIEKNRVWLNLTNEEGAFKQMLVGYIEGASNDYDRGYDGLSFDGNKYIDFYSIEGTRKFVIQGRGLPFVDTDLVPLGYKTTIAGDFTISIDQVDGFFNTQAIYLEDKTTGKIQDLSKANYTFTTAIGIFTDRFVLRYTNKTLGTGDFENIENGLLVSVKDKAIKVTSAKEAIKEVTIFDITGKTLYTKTKVNSNDLQISNLQSGNQVLLVKVMLENDFITSKKILFQ